jgi:hypothetical protein
LTTGSSVPEAGVVEVAAGPAVVSPGAGRVSTTHVAVAAALAAAVSIAALRVTPQVWGDPGVWLSVAARLLDGDRLYADVFDNKDPFFFYSYALSLRIAGVRGPFALEVVWLAVGTVGLAMALRTLRVGTLAVVTGAVVYPLALTASWYVPGATMVPALAIAPLALWLWARGAAVAAGFLVVVAMLFKLNLGLVVAAPLVALLLVGDAGASRRRRAAEGTCGAAVALALCALLLGVRGELRPYLDTIAYNVHYSDAGVNGGGLHAHLSIVRVFFAAAGKWQLPAAVLATVALLVVSLVGWQRGSPGFRRVAAAAVATLLAAFVTLATTAVFTVHLQLLAYPAALGCATLVVALRRLWRPLGVAAAAICIALAARASLGQEDLSALSIRTWTVAPVSTPGTAHEATRARLFPDGRRVSYAVFGRNTEDGHAAFVSRSMDMQCRYFHQYPFYREAQLQETLDCARRSQPQLILVTTSFYDPMPGHPAWERFVAETRAMLRSRYDLVTREGMTEVWRQRSAAGPTA